MIPTHWLWPDDPKLLVLLASLHPVVVCWEGSLMVARSQLGMRAVLITEVMLNCSPVPAGTRGGQPGPGKSTASAGAERAAATLGIGSAHHHILCHTGKPTCKEMIFSLGCRLCIL